jgi:hypothetical protein
MTEETSFTEPKKKIIEFAQVKHDLLSLNMLITFGLVVFTWLVIAGAGWYLHHQDQTLESQIGALANKPGANTSTVTDSAAVEPIIQRIAFLEEQVNQLSIQGTQKPLENLGDTTPQVQVLNPSPALQSSIDSLQQQVTQTQMALEELRRSRSASAGVVTAILLRDAVNKGRPFSQELATLANVAGQDEMVRGYINALQAYADEGIVNPTTLKEEFQKVIPLALKAAQTNTDESGVKKWVKENLSEVVQVRRIGKDVEGDATEAVLARAEAYVQQGRFRQALKELAVVQGRPEEDVVRPWAIKAETRLNAQKAANGIYDHMLSFISQPAG